MAHFAQLDENNVVLQVIVVNNSECLDENGSESEAVGVAFCQSLFPNTRWKQTSYNATFRGKLAGIGDTYDAVNNVFVAPVVVQQEVPAGLPTMDLSVLETQPEAAITSQVMVDLSSTDLPALNSSDVAALTSEQITGL